MGEIVRNESRFIGVEYKNITISKINGIIIHRRLYKFWICAGSNKCSHTKVWLCFYEVQA